MLLLLVVVMVMMITGPDLRLVHGAPVQKKMWGPYYMNTPSPDCLHPIRTVVIIDIF